MDKSIVLEPTAQDIGMRLDKYISEQLEEYTRSTIQGWMMDGRVQMGEKVAQKNDKIKVPVPIKIFVPEVLPLEIVPENLPLDIVYEDEDLIVVNKERGMVVHPAAGNWSGTLVHALMYYCGASLSGINGVLRPGIVHRIDKDTSGLMVVAKNDVAHQSLAQQIAHHTARREYEAIVQGGFEVEQGTVHKPIGRSKTDRKKMAIVPDGKDAITHYQVVARYRGYTHLHFQLETGRTHQIRVHMASIGHPIVGDLVYGHGKDRFAYLNGQCLHAQKLTFIHPKTGKEMTFFAPNPPYFKEVIQRLEQALKH